MARIRDLLAEVERLRDDFIVAAKRAEKAGFETSFTVDRKACGVEWNRVLDTGGTRVKIIMGSYGIGIERIPPQLRVQPRLEAYWES